MKPKSDDCYSPGYLPTGAEFLYANRRRKSLTFSSYNRNISSAKRLHLRLSYQLTLYSYYMANDLDHVTNVRRKYSAHVITPNALFTQSLIHLSISFDPPVIISDFELAMVQASTMSFPNSYHRGCYYHFMQAI